MVVPRAISAALGIGLNRIRSKNVMFNDPSTRKYVPAVRFTLQIPVRDSQVPFVVYLMTLGSSTVVTDGVSFRETTESTRSAIDVLRSKAQLIQQMQ